MGRASHKEAKKAEIVHRHSGWLIPAGMFLALLLLSGLLLGWYLRPGLKSPTAPTGQSNLVQVTMRGTHLVIPANYIESSTARAGGERDAIILVALFPSWRGYSPAEARLFSGNAPDQPVIRLTMRGDPGNLDAHTRLNRIYLPHIMAPKGTQGPFGLTQYDFAENSGYDGNDLFAGEGAGGLALLLCERASADFASPNCLAVDRPLARNLSFSYRFKRAYLARWREMDIGVDQLIARFRQQDAAP